ncbi:MAG: metallophosphoesterase [Saprospiraceae bacterium]|nr:metallophosphoesterase [Saprospiraceae bacterium]
MRFAIILTVLMLALDFYVFQAFRTITQGWSSNAKTAVTIAFWSVPVFAFILMLIGVYTNFPVKYKGVFVILNALVFIIYASKFMVALVLLVDDIRRLAMSIGGRFGNNSTGVDLSRSRFLSQMGVLLGSLPLLTLTYGMIRNPYRYKVFRERVKIKNLPSELEGLKIVQISDIHAGSFTFKDPVKNAIDLINAENPDLVFFTGDLVNDRSEEMADFMDVFDKIRAKYGVFSVLGNHDYGDYVEWPSREAKQQNLEKMIQIHKTLGWRLLMNEHEKLSINGQELAIIGVENYSALSRFPKHGDLAKAHQGTENTVLKLLLSHDPSHWDEQVNQLFQDIALTFSGHTHGCQFGVEIPGFIKWSPVQYLYKQWAGLYRKGEQFIYVNRGLGFVGYPGRVGILPEVAVIELAKA